MSVKLKPLMQDGLTTFRELLGSSDFGGCFCAVWSGFGEDWVARCQDRSQPNFLMTKASVEAGRHVGFFVYQDETLVGWTGSGPKTAFPLLRAKPGSRLSAWTPRIWSIGCLAVRETFRGKGIADFIVQAVINQAAADGAVALEAYPARPFHEPRLFRGTYRLYQRLGFAELGAEKDGEHEIVLMSVPLLGLATPGSIS